jgi:hypothetical protein
VALIGFRKPLKKQCFRFSFSVFGKPVSKRPQELSSKTCFQLWKPNSVHSQLWESAFQAILPIATKNQFPATESHFPNLDIESVASDRASL